MEETLVGRQAGAPDLSHGPGPRGKTGIDRDRVSAWWLPLTAIGADDWPLLDALLIPEERERAARFHFERDRQVYVAAHALARGLLCHHTGRPAQDWRFSVGEHGKPEVICPPGLPRLRLNLSHTRGMAVAAVTVDNDVGVDVEWLERTVDADLMAERVFAAKERLVLAAVPAAAKAEIFLSFWTLKEAYVKAIGKGLSQPLAAFSFDLETLGIHFDDATADDPAQWRFERHQPGPEHLIALAVRHSEPARLEIQTGPAPLAYLRQLASI
ncbi:4'-phosphopantetheinyl transferase family protein [Aureimonas glaciei]|uniref:4'-phosphopantetheinyl transferase n=1 Tax=Aureimonas glaciei TaxID=1776957 RepID=A0A916XXG6_9HYPH|nr:4'-phosphopantetheinyl transferase superfamily protein [Aureimonas glaciei]GGD19227.1 hypothetical protein GCM10011335_22630 [Aureimonas glaciei]